MAQWMVQQLAEGILRPASVPSLTARMVGRLTLKVLAAAFTVLPFSRKLLTASTCSADSVGRRPRSYLRRSPVHAGLDPIPDGVPLPLCQGEEHVKHEPRDGAIVASFQALR